jgi:hypothetical protein
LVKRKDGGGGRRRQPGYPDDESLCLLEELVRRQRIEEMIEGVAVGVDV